MKRAGEKWERCDLCITELDFDHEVRIGDEVYCSQGCAHAHGHWDHDARCETGPRTTSDRRKDSGKGERP
jgi:hypothetical protein